MASMVLVDSTLESLTSSVNAPLGFVGKGYDFRVSEWGWCFYDFCLSVSSWPETAFKLIQNSAQSVCLK
jgi:hypothetical protein